MPIRVYVVNEKVKILCCVKSDNPKAFTEIINIDDVSGGNREWLDKTDFHHNIFNLMFNSINKVLTEWFVDRQVSLDVEHGGSSNLVFLENVSSTTIEYTINTTDGVFRALQFCKSVN